MIKRLTQTLLLVLGMGLLALPGFAQENRPLNYRQPVVHGRARATLSSWRVVLVFRGGRWHRQRRWVYDRDDWRARRYYSWRARRDYRQARRWRWENRRERWGDRRERWQERWGRDG
jgi:hypothetical protein